MINDFKFQKDDIIFSEVPLVERTWDAIALQKTNIFHDWKSQPLYEESIYHGKKKMRLIIREFAKELAMEFAKKTHTDDTSFSVWYNLEETSDDSFVQLNLCLGICDETVYEKFENELDFHLPYKIITPNHNIYAVVKKEKSISTNECRLICKYENDEYESVLTTFSEEVKRHVVLYLNRELNSKEYKDIEAKLHYSLQFVQNKNNTYVYLNLRLAIARERRCADNNPIVLKLVNGEVIND